MRIAKVRFMNAFQVERLDPQGLKPAFFMALGGTAEQLAEKVGVEQKSRPQRLKPHSKQCSYRSAEALRHPKSSARSSFSAAREAVPYPKPIYETRSKESVNKYLSAANDRAARWLCADKSVRATLENCR
jgi:hypothetical protein